MRLPHADIGATIERARTFRLIEAIRALADDDRPRPASAQQVAWRSRQLLDRYADPTAASRQLERVLKGNDLTDVSYLARGLQCARSVCRIEIRSGGRRIGYGTGFLVAPGVVMTNQHVLSSRDEAAGSLAQFGYERNLRGDDPVPISFRILATPEPIILKELDFALAAVEPASADGRRLEEFGWLRLSPQPAKGLIGEYLTIIQHPGGEPKQICVRENKLLKYDPNGPFVWYETDTAGGSSGSPAFNNDWDVVALHHSAVPRTKRVRGQDVWIATNGEPWTSDMGEDKVDWIANEGIRISRIVDYLAREKAGDPLARAVVDAKAPPVFESALDDAGWSGQIRTMVDGSGQIRVRIPIELGIRSIVGDAALRAPVAAAPADGAAPASFGAGGPVVVEAVKIDPNYAKRPGYLPKFLGSAKALLLPLPKVVSHKSDVLSIQGQSELKYWTYSVLFSKPRRLAIVSAANVDPSQWAGNRDAEGDTWYDDARVTKVDPKLQVDAAFYKKQASFEADRSKNPFDQGHLTRRKDVQWGGTDAIAKRNGDDSYHYTNCAPQHWAFNQNSKVNGIWFRLEEYAAAASAGKRFSIFNGPIFDAPLCKQGSDGVLRLDPKGKRAKDGTFGGVKIPKQFFKVFAWVANGALRAAAFIVTQEGLLKSIAHLHPQEAIGLTPLEIQLYQVSVATVAKLTGLDFGPLKGAPDTDEAFAGGDASAGGPITDPAQLRF